MDLITPGAAETVEPGVPWQIWTAACAALFCLFVVSALVLVIVLVRRNRRDSASDGPA